MVTSIVAVLKSHSVLLPVWCMEWCCFPLKNLVDFSTSCNRCSELSKIRRVRLIDFSSCLSAPPIHVLKWVKDLHDNLPDVLARSCWKGEAFLLLSWVLALLPARTFCFSFGTLLLIWYDALMQRNKLAENTLPKEKSLSALESAYCWGKRAEVATERESRSDGQGCAVW